MMAAMVPAFIVVSSPSRIAVVIVVTGAIIVARTIIIVIARIAVVISRIISSAYSTGTNFYSKAASCNIRIVVYFCKITLVSC